MDFKLLFVSTYQTIKGLFSPRGNRRADAVLKALKPTSLRSVPIQPRRYEEKMGGRGRLY